MNRRQTATVIQVCVAGFIMGVMTSSEVARAVVRPAIAKFPLQSTESGEIARPATPPAAMAKQASRDPSNPLSAGSIAVELRPRAETESARVMLDQVAICLPARTMGFDCAEVAGVDAGAAPAPGRTARFSRASMMEILGKEFPGATIEVLGAESSFVSARGVPLADDLLANPFRRQLEEIFVTNPDFRVQVTGLRIEQRPQVRPGDVSCRFAQIDLLKQRMQDPAGASVESDIESLVTRIHNGALFNAQCVQEMPPAAEGEAESPGESIEPPFYVQFMPKILVERRMPVARHDVPAKTLFREEDSVEAWVPWTRGTGRAVRDVSSLAGMALVRPVQAGQTLLMRDFERPVVLRRGDTVQLQQKNGDLTISSNAVVVTQGAVGDRIEVQAVGTRKRLRAIVKSNSVVEAM